jgi:hypothetical protein
MTPEHAAAYVVDKTGWAEGPWMQEPDRRDWRAHGLPCLALRNHHGTWCGYVGVPPGHPWYDVSYAQLDVEVHGGLTYSARCTDHICHVAAPGEPDEVFWLGFDCGHAFDYAPGIAALAREIGLGQRWPEETYRDLAYVSAEIERLAEQAATATEVK